VSQISLPFRIALLAMLAVCAVWFTVLKPKAPAPTPATTAPGVTGLANDVKAAKGAAKASDAANAKVQNATGGTAAQTDTSAAKAKTRAAHAAVTGKTAATAKAAPTKKAPAKKATADASAPLLTALGEKKAVVLVFYNAKGSDDRAVRAAAGRVSHRHGRVIVKTVPVSRLGRYAPITKGVAVAQTPTVMVLAPGNTARTIVGFTTQSEIDQLVGDALTAKAGK
jgi:hypothetical protein